MRAGLAAALVFAAALACAPAATAKTANSTNWAGFAVHHPGVSFRQISGTWTQPNAACVDGHPSYSAAWVGLGGYKPTSHALEQIGTEVDCGAGGKVRSSAWYELVPAPSKPIALRVRPGDVMRATVTVAGHQVTVDLENLTRHRAFDRTLSAPDIDVSSAEWIVEAPSECISQFACQALPLADFGSVTFDSASATTTGGTKGPIANARWWRTKIELTPGAQPFILARNASDEAGIATPSTLRANGTQFDVAYSTVAATADQSATTRQSRVRAGYLQH